MSELFIRWLAVLTFITSSSLRDSCPTGVYLSLTPGNPSLWAGVLFIRKGTVITTTSLGLQAEADVECKGPYARAILRFQISFPDTYPDLPPVVTFSSDIFHPLVVPLTTYTFSASAGDASNTLSASDTERLPPGAFSPRLGFPDWFRPGDTRGDAHETFDVTEEDRDRSNDWPIPRRNAPSEVRPGRGHKDRKCIILDLLQHLQDAFQDETVLDNMPLDTAANPSAWHAWRAYRGLVKTHARPNNSVIGNVAEETPSPKHPGEWKWDGVWESRVANAIDASVSEVALFGSNNAGTGNMRNLDARQRMLLAADRQIRFSKLDEEHFEAVKAAITTYDSATPS